MRIKDDIIFVRRIRRPVDRATFVFHMTAEQRRRWASSPGAEHRPALIARIAAGLA